MPTKTLVNVSKIISIFWRRNKRILYRNVISFLYTCKSKSLFSINKRGLIDVNPSIPFRILYAIVGFTFPLLFSCLEYNLYQEAYNPNVFFFYEEFKNMDAIRFYGKQKYMKTFQALRTSMLVGKLVAFIYKSTAIK